MYVNSNKPLPIFYSIDLIVSFADTNNSTISSDFEVLNEAFNWFSGWIIKKSSSERSKIGVKLIWHFTILCFDYLSATHFQKHNIVELIYSLLCMSIVNKLSTYFRRIPNYVNLGSVCELFILDVSNQYNFTSFENYFTFKWLNYDLWREHSITVWSDVSYIEHHIVLWQILSARSYKISPNSCHQTQKLFIVQVSWTNHFSSLSHCFRNPSKFHKICWNVAK